jgi:hypothetical protein
MPLLLPADPQHLPQHTLAALVDDVQPDRPTQPCVELALERIESERAKCRTTTALASNSRPAPAAMPMAADSQRAAVVSPCTAPRRVIMMSAPKKPMPETIWAATREGSSSAVCADKTSAKPHLLINMISADDVPTMVWVRSPALLPWIVRSRPMSVQAVESAAGSAASIENAASAALTQPSAASPARRTLESVSYC